MFKGWPKNLLYGIDQFKKDYGLNESSVWFEAFNGAPKKDRDYLRKGEERRKLNEAPRIKLATIHGVEGNECDNVVLPYI